MWQWLPSWFVPRYCSWRCKFLDSKGAPGRRATGHSGSRDVDRVGLLPAPNDELNVAELMAIEGGDPFAVDVQGYFGMWRVPDRRAGNTPGSDRRWVHPAAPVMS